MSSALIDRDYFMGQVNTHCPTIADSIEKLIPTSPEVGIQQLNTIFRYELAKLENTDTSNPRNYLCESLDVPSWVENFCNKVLPALTK